MNNKNEVIKLYKRLEMCISNLDEDYKMLVYGKLPEQILRIIERAYISDTQMLVKSINQYLDFIIEEGGKSCSYFGAKSKVNLAFELGAITPDYYKVENEYRAMLYLLVNQPESINVVDTYDWWRHSREIYNNLVKHIKAKYLCIHDI